MISFPATVRCTLIFSILANLTCVIGCSAAPPNISLQQAEQSNTDLWGEAAMKQPNGPTYEYFEKLLPPLRYVDANFRCYPIVLCAPTNRTKARLVSDGSSINARARSVTWSHEQGTPTFFYMGDKREPFGKDLASLQGPKFLDGYLPVVQMTYSTQGSVWEQESFCSTDPALADSGVVFLKFTLKSATPTARFVPKIREERLGEAIPGVENAENVKLISQPYDDRMEAWFEGPALYTLEKGRVMAPPMPPDEALAQMRATKPPEKKPTGQVLALVHPGWITNPGRGAVIAPMKTGQSVYLAIFTKKVDPDDLKITLTPDEYEKQRDTCIKTWNDLLDAGAKFETPETVVNNAWRSEVIMNYMLTAGDEMHYSACNQYDGIYIGEGGDTIFGLGLYGHPKDAERLEPAQFKSQRKGLEFHRAAFKLQMLCKCYHLDPDPDFVRVLEPLWQKEIDIILKGRESSTGMLPKEQYCGDVHTYVYSLNSNANCWRALRHMSILCQETGRTEQAQQLATTAAEYRKVILDALDKAIDKSVDPPFVPVALSGEEDPHVPIWGTTMGSYWNLMIHYILASGIFPADSDTAGDVLHYVEHNGGLCMGMLRARNTPGNWYVLAPRVNDLYGMRRNLVLLQRDEADLALVGFYGKLAQGMTRDTFIGGEVTCLGPVDQFGRQVSLPPNSAANSNYLQTLRYLLVQDYDTDDDGKADTLRLCFATPRAWLADGKTIKVTDAPTAFGPVSFTIQPRLSKGIIDVDLNLPTRNPPSKILLRLRLPDGAKVVGAKDGETLDISVLKGHAGVQAKVKR